MNINPNEIREIRVFGCGGTGCHVATGLARLEVAITALGGAFPNVTLLDHDLVDLPNVGRQLYSEHDVGTYKSIALAQRINACYGLSWKHSLQDSVGNLNLICVDSRAARKKIYPKPRTPTKKGKFKQGEYCPYFIDFGNENSTGQVIFGGGALPMPHELYPELVDTSIRDSKAPSCSLAEALESQELFVNQFVASYGLQILWQIFRRGRINQRGFFINLDGCSIPIPM